MIRVTRSAIIDAPIERVWELVRDFNSHTAWHPIIARSEIEDGEPSDRIGCVRSFTLASGDTVREQLLTLDDEAHVSTYCILDATVPLERYVATVTLKEVTDGDRTFWHWTSTFRTPPGRERELAEMVAKNVYEDGFAGIRKYLNSGSRSLASAPPPPTRLPTRRSSAASVDTGRAMESFSTVVQEHGGPDAFDYRKTSARAPGPGEVRIRHAAIGVNYIDVYVRNGLYGALMEVPGVPGMEAAGVVVDVGAGVTHLLPGDRVAYACAPVGAYTTLRTMPAESVLRLPAAIDDETAAAVLFKGLTAEYLLHRVHHVERGDWLLVHAAAGGVGQLLCQWAKALGARVIGTVSSEEKARIARDAGCEHAIVTRDYRFAAEVKRVTGGLGAHVIYDGLGQAAVEENLEAAALTGYWVSYGQASGPIEPIAPERFNEKSLTFSRPVLFHYSADRYVLETMASRVFDLVGRGTLRAAIGARYPLASAANAHRDLEARKTTGSVLLIP